MLDRQTGYPSVDKPWLKYYRDNADELANSIPENKTIWDVIEESFYKHMDIPAIDYFGRRISRKEFIENVYLWAKAFKSLGVKEDEIVAYYGPFMPDVLFMLFGLNVIGACPYFLKLAIDPDVLAEETKECRFAMVFDKMWDRVACEFQKNKYEKIIIFRITDAMPIPKKQIVSFLSAMQGDNIIPKEDKYISVSQARKMSAKYSCDIRVPFVKNRNAFITSSSGTTVGGLVKGVIATNESVIAQAYSTIYSDTPYRAGDVTLNHFPPTAATSLNSLCFVGLISGATIMIDPRVSEKAFYKQLVSKKPSMCINTGSLWETFFNRVEYEMKKGKRFDFSYSRGWMIGGEGTTVDKMKKWTQIVQKCGGSGLFGGYGLSETFSGICIDRTDFRALSKQIVGIGVPQAGMVVGVYDKAGDELSYNQRGELWVKTKAAMKGYYNKPDLTEKTKVDGWIHTGDLAEIDENGFVYVWGRMNDTVKLSDEREIYLFDIAYKIIEKEFINDAVVLEKSIEDGNVNLVAHIVWDKSVKEADKLKYLMELNESIRQFEPDINLCAYAVYDEMLPYSPTTLKKDKNRMAVRTEGFIQIIDGEIKEISFIKDKNGCYSMKIA